MMASAITNMANHFQSTFILQGFEQVHKFDLRVNIRFVLPVGGVGEDAFPAHKGAGRGVPNVALVVGGDTMFFHEEVEQPFEGVQLRCGVSLKILEATVFLVGAILVDVFHRLAFEVGHYLAVLPRDGIEETVRVQQQRTPAVKLDADAGWVKVTPAEPSDEELAAQARAAEVEELKMQLAESDYKVIKIAECVACGLPLPYDAEALHSERQALRDRINLLEGEP